MKYLLLIIYLFAITASANDFDARAIEGYKAMETPEGKKYEREIAPAVLSVMRTCIKPGSTSPENLGTFIFIGYVSQEGYITSPEVQPSTKVSECFFDYFKKIKLPSPPKALNTEFGVPLTIKMEVNE